jgi:DnaK suppressor protein
VPAAEKTEHFKRLLETRIVETERTIANSEQEIRAISARQADSADQAAAEYERQALAAHKAAVARQNLQNLRQALERIVQGTFGECAECGNEIESKRLEAILWARYCLKCQELREHR